MSPGAPLREALVLCMLLRAVGCAEGITRIQASADTTCASAGSGVLGAGNSQLCARLQQLLPPPLGLLLARPCSALSSRGERRAHDAPQRQAAPAKQDGLAASSHGRTHSHADAAVATGAAAGGVVELGPCVQGPVDDATFGGGGSRGRSRVDAAARHEQVQQQHQQGRAEGLSGDGAGGSRMPARRGKAAPAPAPAGAALQELAWGHGACYDLASDFGAVAADRAQGAVAGAQSAVAARKVDVVGGGGGGGGGAGLRPEHRGGGSAKGSAKASVRSATSAYYAAAGGRQTAAGPDRADETAPHRRRGLLGAGEARGTRGEASYGRTGSASGSGAGSGAGRDGGGGGAGSGADGGWSPVLYLAPLTGTGLQARLKNNADWFTLWPALTSVLPPAFPCYADNLRLEPARGAACGPQANATTVCPVSPPGVEVRLGSAFGEGGGGGEGEGSDGGGRSAGAMEELGPWGAVASRLRQLGWPSELLEVHPYDWRLNPAAWRRPGGDFARLKDTIERLVAAAGGRRVVLYGVSLGASYAAAFLDTRAHGPAAAEAAAAGGGPAVSEEWKAAHVERLVSSSGVWEGTAHSVWDLLSGRLEGLEAVLDRAAARQLVRGLPSLTWTFPTPAFTVQTRTPGTAGTAGRRPTGAVAQQQADEEGPHEGTAQDGVPHAEAQEAQVVVMNAATGRNYTAAQLGQALKDAGGEEAAAFWEAALPDMSPPSPNITVYCFYSYGLTAPVRLTYSTADFVSDSSPSVLYGNGDVTAPYESLAACRRWAAAQPPDTAPVHAMSYYGIVHAQLTMVPAALDDIVAAVAVAG
ncbi:hypothetical protein HYH02_013440 [Chlamydomonas schloesseri]|uniref:AB hydrolase-1 domain-containing protein n=1 Tax=Chlamydomonas schloesseri TaxID=2026947 RepID=A0A835VZF0_9CHLO|nr:hypothetical protein HYH02_013440 [Chlamydomonas schloesseri]|eukprot:KAG2431309.1 hypothetical protein HYH02_013440 [Chlamydomonas schloesseri]